MTPIENFCLVSNIKYNKKNIEKEKEKKNKQMIKQKYVSAIIYVDFSPMFIRQKSVFSFETALVSESATIRSVAT